LAVEEQVAISNYSRGNHATIPLANVARGVTFTHLSAILDSEPSLKPIVANVRREARSFPTRPVIEGKSSDTLFLDELCALVCGRFARTGGRDPLTPVQQSAARAGSHPKVNGLNLCSVVGKDITREAWDYGLGIFGPFIGQGPQLHVSLLASAGLVSSDPVSAAHYPYMDWWEVLEHRL
jgi:hypothetical protein